MAYAASTEVSAEKSRAEIEKLLARHKCTKFMTGVDHETHSAMVQFQAHNRIVKFIVALPNPTDPKYKRVKNSWMDRNAAGIAKVVAQEERTRWRALLLVIKAKLESVESGIASFEDEFLAHTLLPNQQTVAEYIGPAVAQMYETGRMPPANRQLAAESEVIDTDK